MNTKQLFQHFFGILILLAVLTSCVASGPTMTIDKISQDTGPFYTASNMWHEHPDMWSTNYRRGHMIPVGTQVSSLRLMKEQYEYVEFTVKKTNTTFRIHLVPKHNPGLAGEALLNRLFTKKTKEQLTNGYTETEIKAVNFGLVTTTMSKEAVLVSRGYPPEIGTASIEDSKWLFWNSKFNKKALYFNEEGRVENVVD